MGNICRSPAAEGLMRHKLEQRGLEEGKDFEVDSAGTINHWQGSSPDDRSQTVMKNNGIDISSQKSRPLTEEDGDNFDVILCMDSNNIAGAKDIIAKKNHHKIRLLDNSEVDDPFVSVAAGFDQMYNHIDCATDELINELFG
jgi:protein-tyrosine phosphatase